MDYFKITLLIISMATCLMATEIEEKKIYLDNSDLKTDSSIGFGYASSPYGTFYGSINSGFGWPGYYGGFYGDYGYPWNRYYGYLWHRHWHHHHHHHHHGGWRR